MLVVLKDGKEIEIKSSAIMKSEDDYDVSTDTEYDTFDVSDQSGNTVFCLPLF